MSDRSRLALAIVLGLALALGGAQATFLGIWTLVPWGIGAFAVGWRARMRVAAIAGALYGFVLAVTFMIAVYTGTAPVMTKLPGFAVLGIVGAICGAVAAMVGARLSARNAPIH